MSNKPITKANYPGDILNPGGIAPGEQWKRLELMEERGITWDEAGDWLRNEAKRTIPEAKSNDLGGGA